MKAYFDHNATTRIDDEVLAAMLPYLRDEYGNASSRHDAGTRARKAVNLAREQVASLVNVEPSQVVFVSGGTEANNMFVKGMASYLKPARIAISSIEHPCVMKPAATLARSGWKPRKIRVGSDGVLDLADAEAALREPTGLVSVMLANNETGVVQPVAEVAILARAANAWMHTDAVQCAGKLPVDFDSLGVHAMSLSAHKMYGPKGAGALVIDKRLPIKPLIDGGGHEGGLRSGTENVPAIVGFGTACELAQRRRDALAQHTAQLRDLIEAGLVEQGAAVFGAGAPRLPNTSYFAFDNIDGELLVIELNKAGFAVASGSACSSTSTEPSTTLLAMGVDPDLARGAVRISLGEGNARQQAQEFLTALAAVVDQTRRMSAVAV
jgi:cysteine desulfurase